MADKAITDLNVVPGSIDDSNTWFAVAQSNAAYKVSGHEFVLAMSSIWNAHGGIRSIVYTDPVPPSLTGTLTITLADNSTVSFDVENGRGIASIAKTGTVDLVDTYTITYNDGTTSTFSVTNGEKGDTGDAWYVWIRYAGSQPTQDSDIGTTPDNWMGIYSGTSSTAPVHYTDYDWFEIKGEKGDTGQASTLVSNDIQYQQSDNGSVVPSGSWSTSIPAPVAGKYLWTRTVLTFNSGSPVTFYSVSRYGIDGTGAVSSVNSISPDGNGNVVVTASDIQTTDNTSIQSDLNGLKNTLSKLIPVITGSTNNSGYTINIGDYFIANGSLYQNLTASAIPIGGAWNGTAPSGTTTNKIIERFGPYSRFIEIGTVSNTTKILHFGGTAYTILVSFGGSDARLGMWLVRGAAGNVFYKDILASSLVTLAGSENGTLTITTSASSIEFFAIVISGSGTIS